MKFFVDEWPHILGGNEENRKRNQKMEKRKRKGWTRGQKIVVGVTLLWFLVVMLVFAVVYLTSGNWLTASMQKEGDLVYFAGADLTEQVSAYKQLEHYYERGDHVALIWVGYVFVEKLGAYASVWRIPSDMIFSRPLTPVNNEWSVDFWWPLRRGPFPPGAIPGTSSY